MASVQHLSILVSYDTPNKSYFAVRCTSPTMRVARIPSLARLYWIVFTIGNPITIGNRCLAHDPLPMQLWHDGNGMACVSSSCLAFLEKDLSNLNHLTQLQQALWFVPSATLSLEPSLQQCAKGNFRSLAVCILQGRA